MAWTDIIGQDRIKHLLQRMILEQRLPQAMLFSGMAGTGAVGLAIEFARTTNCIDPVRTATGIDACGVCRSCAQFRHLGHPNLRLTVALPAGKGGEAESDMKSDVIEELKTQIQALADDPYVEVRLPNATQIKIGAIRELKRTLTLSAAQEGGRRVCLIIHADEMTTEASNAFLKTLEEPHEGVTIILTTERPERMLQTITSRCQEVVVPPLGDDLLAEALHRRDGIPEADATLIASFAQGSYTRARSFMNEDMRGYRQDVVDLLRLALKGQSFRIPLTEALAEIAEGKDKVKVEMMLSLLLLWLRDAYSIVKTGTSASIMNIDQRDALEKFAASFGNADYPRVLRAVEHSVRLVHRNVNLTLVLLPLLLDIRRVFHEARSATMRAS